MSRLLEFLAILGWGLAITLLVIVILALVLLVGAVTAEVKRRNREGWPK